MQPLSAMHSLARRQGAFLPFRLFLRQSSLLPLVRGHATAAPVVSTSSTEAFEAGGKDAAHNALPSRSSLLNKMKHLSICLYRGEGIDLAEFTELWRTYQAAGYVMDVTVLGPVLSVYHNAGLHFTAIRLYEAFPAIQWEPWMYNIVARCAFITRNTKLLDDIMDKAPLTESSARLFLEIRFLLHMHRREYVEASNVFSQIDQLSGTMTDWGIGNLINAMLRDNRAFPAVKYLDVLARKKIATGNQGPGFSKFLEFSVSALMEQSIQLKDSRIALQCLRLMEDSNIKVSPAVVRSAARVSRYGPDPDLAQEVYQLMKANSLRDEGALRHLLPGICASDNFKTVFMLLSEINDFQQLLHHHTLSSVGSFVCRMALNPDTIEEEEEDEEAQEGMTLPRPAALKVSIADIRNILQLFADLPSPAVNYVVLSTAAALAEFGRTNEVIDFADKLTEDPVLGTRAYEVMMHACASIPNPQLQLGQTLFDRLREEGRPASDAFINGYLKLLCRAGKGKRALKLLKVLLSDGNPPPKTGTETVCRWALAEVDKEALQEVLQELMKVGFQFSINFMRQASLQFPRFRVALEAVRAGEEAGNLYDADADNVDSEEEEDAQELLSVAAGIDSDDQEELQGPSFYDTSSEDEQDAIEAEDWAEFEPETAEGVEQRADST